ncbi:MAG: YgfZ/GcvT domain-containing protein [Rhabdaerophilum sp.]
MPQFIPLPERSLLVVAGKDAAHFLHNLVTANVEQLAPGMMISAALLTPQGKIITEMLIANAGEEGDDEGLFLIDVSFGYAEDLLTRLAQYKLRAEVTIGHAPEGTSVSALFDAPDYVSEDIYVFADPRHAGLGKRLVGPADALKAIGAGFEIGEPKAYHLRRVSLGVPEMGKDYPSIDAFPHEVLLDQLGGVDFKKGCYVGQEVVSRMQHRGTARTRALPVRFLNGFGVLGGATVKAGETVLGSIGESFADRAIARIRLDKLEDALQSGTEIVAGGVPIEATKPDFATFEVPIQA